ncbi:MULTISPECIES: glycosyltransferase family 2 protein [Kitasatospora]|uniref:Glycosyltransferase involved in cell wall biosynthesis n=2 Tax=Kitasatospora TaxID=2063 RepID=A0ABT1IXM4_9ACTN|nr:glycosyltransferase [Kitasatospora paracochleata]MCP2309910.1 glycosyltransferase involved in cell wall biosynthesis [Kitasatospora paracochleata]
MPRFSVIVPVYQVEEYLQQCLDSVLSEPYTDYELIAVDDRSPDGSGVILDKAAAADPRVTVLHLENNVGLGRARNAGLEVATGEYVLFLDSDDTLTPGLLADLDARLRATGDPDIAIYDYARTYWDGRVVRSASAGIFGRPGPDAFALDERPEVLDILMVVWNKAYKREFVDAQGLVFPAGYYEDTPWTFPALLAADRITLLDQVGLHYRQRREGGNILATPSRKHFDIFDQYDLVFAFLDRRPDLDRWRPEIYGRMLRHLLTIVTKPDRVPPADRREFFRRAAAHCARLRPADYRAPGGSIGLRTELLSRGHWFAFQGARAAARARRMIKR